MYHCAGRFIQYKDYVDLLNIDADYFTFHKRASRPSNDTIMLFSYKNWQLLLELLDSY